MTRAHRGRPWFRSDIAAHSCSSPPSSKLLRNAAVRITISKTRLEDCGTHNAETRDPFRAIERGGLHPEIYLLPRPEEPRSSRGVSKDGLRVHAFQPFFETHRLRRCSSSYVDPA